MKGAGLLLTLGLTSACGGGSSSTVTRESVPAAATADVGPLRAASATAEGGARGTILFLGTSLTAGLGLEADSAYPQQIQRKIDAAGLSYRVVNAGVSGETAAGLLQRLDWVLQTPAQVIVVETGANDGLRGQAVGATRNTIGEILDRIRRTRPAAKVLLVQMEAPTNLGAEYTRAFHAMFPALAREKDVTLLPFLLDRVAGVATLNQPDGVHPNYAGERIVTENVWRGLREVVGG